MREAAAKEEAKNESKTGHDLVKGADRFEERSKSSDGKSAEEKQKGQLQTADPTRRLGVSPAPFDGFEADVGRPRPRCPLPAAERTWGRIGWDFPC